MGERGEREDGMGEGCEGGGWSNLVAEESFAHFAFPKKKNCIVNKVRKVKIHHLPLERTYLLSI
jgi:hypothetical protein